MCLFRGIILLKQGAHINSDVAQSHLKVDFDCFKFMLPTPGCPIKTAKPKTYR